MKSFKQFISEKVSAGKALDRLKWMRKGIQQPHIVLDKDGNAKFDEKHAIKLPYERGEKHANEALRRADKIERWRENAGLGRHEYNIKRKKLSKIVSSPSKLNYGQEWTDATDEEKLKQKADPGLTRGHTVITSHKDENGEQQHTVFDGHHALVGSIARSVDPTVRHVDLDHEEAQLRKAHPQHEPREGEY